MSWNENFEDAKRLFLSPLMAIHYAHLVMLADSGIVIARRRAGVCATRSTASPSTTSAQRPTTAPAKTCSSTSSA